MASLKCKKFTDLYDFKDDVLSDDYCYKNFETWKFKGKTRKDSVWKYQLSMKLDEKGSGFSGKLDDKLSCQFPFADRYLLWFGIKRSGDLKVHVDCGDLKIQKQSVNLFANVKTDHKFSKFTYRLGANHFGDICESNTRLETNCCNSGICLTQRTLIQKNKFLYGFVGTLGLGLEKFGLCRYDAVLGYENKDFDVYLKHYSPASEETDGGSCFSKGGLKPGVINASVNYRVNEKHQVAGEFEKDFGGKGSQTVQVGAETKVNDNFKVKGKIDLGLNFSFASKWKVNEILTVTASGKLPLSQGAKCLNFENVLPFPLGFQAELNI